MPKPKNKIGIFSPALRISFALVLLNACLILAADLLGFIPSEAKYLLSERKKVSEALAIQFAFLAPSQDVKTIEKMLTKIVQHNADIESVGLRLSNGDLSFQIGNHVNKWGAYAEQKSTDTHLIVPIFHHDELWANIEIKFIDLVAKSGIVAHMQPIFKMSSFILMIGFFANLAFMIRALRVLDPAAIVPERVNAAFDTFSESIVIVDEQEQIILANKAFVEKVAWPASTLIGYKLSDFEWQNPSENKSVEAVNLPWRSVLKTGKKFIGSHLILTPADKQQKILFIVNASPIQDSKGNPQGVLITLDDVTELEKSHEQLQLLVNQLEQSQTDIEKKNKELNFLATRDSLTGCLNRRSFNDSYHKAFYEANQNQSSLAFIMTDIDYFKKVNDIYGHATGDEVIKLFVEAIQATIRKSDWLGRYGGEEFSIALPGLTVAEAVEIAERIRLRLKVESARRFMKGPHVTASFGVAGLSDESQNPDKLQRLADEALYLAKQSGRDRVTLWHAQNELNQVNASNTMIDKESAVDSKELKQRVTELESIATKYSVELDYAKHYDVATGLPNQVLFYDRVGQVVERGERMDSIAAVFILDINEINQVGATFGFEFSDKLLIEISERLRKTFRKYDAVSRLTISRFGGDEFAILLNDIKSKEKIIWIISRLQNVLAEKFIIDGNTVFVTPYIGISLYPSDATNADDLIRNALLAKKYGKQQKTESNYQFFDEQMQKLSSQQVNLDIEIRDSILYETWLLLYQPKMDIKSKKIVGVEALIRWQHPTRGLVSPNEFIEFAEQRGLINAIGDWVIKSACLQIQQWMSLGVDCKVSINISALQLTQEDFVEKLFFTLNSHGVPPRQLEIELTESALMNNFDQVIQALKRLSIGGIKIAIDDFGTGYSSLAYLKNLPLDVLKIDRIFVKDICKNNNDRQIIKALISMAHSLDMKVVAEGVEEKSQLELLTDYKCDEIQGYLLSKPVAADQITILFNKDLNAILDN